MPSADSSASSHIMRLDYASTIAHRLSTGVHAEFKNSGHPFPAAALVPKRGEVETDAH